MAAIISIPYESLLNLHIAVDESLKSGMEAAVVAYVLRASIGFEYTQDSCFAHRFVCDVHPSKIMTHDCFVTNSLNAVNVMYRLSADSGSYMS